MYLKLVIVYILKKMKKLIFILLCIPVLAFGQSRYHSLNWKDTIFVSDMSGSDTIKQAINYTDISGYCWSCTVDAKRLSSNDATITFGGGDKVIGIYRGRYNVYDFNSFVNDSLPYTLDKTKLKYTVKSLGVVDTTYTKQFTGGNTPYGCLQPAYYFNKGSCITGDTLIVDCNFQTK
jgi:hypothetical protein